MMEQDSQSLVKKVIEHIRHLIKHSNFYVYHFKEISKDYMRMLAKKHKLRIGQNKLDTICNLCNNNINIHVEVINE